MSLSVVSACSVQIAAGFIRNGRSHNFFLKVVKNRSNLRLGEAEFLGHTINGAPFILRVLKCTCDSLAKLSRYGSACVFEFSLFLHVVVLII